MLRRFAGAAGALVLAMVGPVVAADCGAASWYGKAHHGHPMANGQPFDMYAMTAASNTLPLWSWARVSAGKRSIVVQITDTGGFAKYGRIIDLSMVAFAKLAPIEQGLAKVCVERLN